MLYREWEMTQLHQWAVCHSATLLYSQMSDVEQIEGIRHYGPTAF